MNLIKSCQKKVKAVLKSSFVISVIYKKVRNLKTLNFVLPYIEMRITTRCNMKCQKCGHLIPCYGKNAKDMTFEQFKVDFDNLINAVTYIKVLSLVGGETTLSKYLTKILEYVLSCDKVGEIRIVSNGKQIPSEELLKLCSNTRVYLHFSQYDQNKENYPIIKQLCKKYNVHTKFYHNTPDEKYWIDYGEVKDYHNSKIKMMDMAQSCYLGGAKQYTNGKLFLCPRIGNAYELGLLELPDCEILEITDDVEKSRKNLIKFYAKSYSYGCRYCNACAEKKIKMAEQIE